MGIGWQFNPTRMLWEYRDSTDTITVMTSYEVIPKLPKETWWDWFVRDVASRKAASESYDD